MLGLLITSAHAQAAAAGAEAQNPIMQFLPIIMVFFVFYFLMIRPQKKKMADEQKFVQELTKGDDIYTKSGLLGKIHGLTDTIVTLELEDGTRVKFLRSQIGGNAKTLFEKKEAKKEAKKEDKK